VTVRLQKLNGEDSVGTLKLWVIQFTGAGSEMQQPADGEEVDETKAGIRNRESLLLLAGETARWPQLSHSLLNTSIAQGSGRLAEGTDAPTRASESCPYSRVVGVGHGRGRFV
jgi:hypothetical protein